MKENSTRVASTLIVCRPINQKIIENTMFEDENNYNNACHFRLTYYYVGMFNRFMEALKHFTVQSNMKEKLFTPLMKNVPEGAW